MQKLGPYMLPTCLPSATCIRRPGPDIVTVARSPHSDALALESRLHARLLSADLPAIIPQAIHARCIALLIAALKRDAFNSTDTCPSPASRGRITRQIGPRPSTLPRSLDDHAGAQLSGSGRHLLHRGASEGSRVDGEGSVNVPNHFLDTMYCLSFSIKLRLRL